jgi:hydroxymethylpyrimidine/phosphomethylpyrimidine kinase
MTPARILSIAGSDSSGGAGIQADIKTITMLGGYAMTAITAVTAQNTRGVQAVETMPANVVAEQIRSCVDDIGVDAIKIGMVGSAAVAQAIIEAWRVTQPVIVFDPVMIASSGAALVDDETREAFDELLAIATLVTPNLPELSALTGQKVDTAEEIEAAALTLTKRFGCAVFAKGGHGSGDTLTDSLFDSKGLLRSWSDPRIETRHTHGTGCTLSAALATRLGQSVSMIDAVTHARRFVRQAIASAPGFGERSGPLGHHAVHQHFYRSSS